MARDVETWSPAERRFIRAELEWFDTGAKLIAAGGLNVMKLDEVEAQLEELQAALRAEIDA